MRYIFILFFPKKIISIKNHFYSKIFGCKFGYLYALKCLFKTKPLQLLCLVMGVSIFSFSFILRICERKVKIKEETMDYDFYTNALWCTLVTMATSNKNQIEIFIKKKKYLF